MKNWVDKLWARPWWPFAVVLIGALVLWLLGYRDDDPRIIQPPLFPFFWMAMAVVVVGAFGPQVLRHLAKRRKGK